MDGIPMDRLRAYVRAIEPRLIEKAKAERESGSIWGEPRPLDKCIILVGQVDEDSDWRTKLIMGNPEVLGSTFWRVQQKGLCTRCGNELGCTLEFNSSTIKYADLPNQQEVEWMALNKMGRAHKCPKALILPGRLH